LMRTGKRRSAEVIISRGLPGNSMFLICSLWDCHRRVALSSRLGLPGR
jgi:hypothetical protein